jgi:hypothetical protein
MKAIIYNEAGEILRTVSAPREIMTLQCKQGEFFVYGEGNDTTQYITQGELTDKPMMPIVIDKLNCLADGVELITVTGIPVGASITLGDLSAIAEDDSLELSFDIPGSYPLSIQRWPYVSYGVTIDAT